MRVESALVVILAINMFLFLGQTAVDNINPGGQDFFNLDGSVLGQLNAGNYTLDEDVTSKFPSSQNTVNPTSGDIFTDPFGTIKKWLFNNPVIQYVVGIINAVPNFLKATGFPVEVVWALGAFWHGLTLFLLVSWALGRS